MENIYGGGALHLNLGAQVVLIEVPKLSENILKKKKKMAVSFACGPF